jgi:thiol-disulfide isomerase/thioredoxin
MLSWYLPQGVAQSNPGKPRASSETAPVTPEPSIADPADVTNPIVQLVCAPAVQQELKCNRQQSAAIRAAYGKIEPRLWLLRDAGAGAAASQKAALLAAMEAELASILEPPQLDRLRQLVVRARGWPGITGPPAAERLQLTPDQLQQIAKINQSALAELEQIASSGQAPAARDEAATKARTAEARSIQALLTDQQRQTLVALVGAPYDLSNVPPLSFAAPEVQPTDTWLNCEPLKLTELRGKVVALHFWAFGCINCVRNLPHYAQWHDDFAGKGLVVLGMHTPETQAERSAANLRAKVAELKIRYPVAFDLEGANWAAWANSLWPSVYLVDKRGRVRYWWYGELNWQGAEGEKLMRARIEALLAE